MTTHIHLISLRNSTRSKVSAEVIIPNLNWSVRAFILNSMYIWFGWQRITI